MIADSIRFELPGCTVEVFRNGQVLFSSTDFPEEDIAESSLGKLLKSVLLRGSLLDESSKSENGEGSLEQHSDVPLRFKVKETSSKVKEPVTKGIAPQVRQTLLDSGVPAETIEYLAVLSVCVRILNTSKNPVKAARTMMDKPGFWERCSAWHAKRKAKEESGVSPAEMEEGEIELPVGKVFQIED